MSSPTHPPKLTRRALLTVPLALARIGSPSPPVALALADAATQWTTAYGLVVTSRAGWVPDTAPIVSGLSTEAAVAVLVVHHSETSNGYAVEDVPKVLRSFRAYHVSPKKGWPDVAYNFFVDRFGASGRDGPTASCRP